MGPCTAMSESTGAVVLDASVVVALSAKEVGKKPVAAAAFDRYVDAGRVFHAPGVLFSECLYVLCKMLVKGALTPPGHADAIRDLVDVAVHVLPPPGGDASLVQRAETLRGAYTCSRSADGLYVATAEQLAAAMPTVLLTFDQEMAKQAARYAPTVVIDLLIP